MKALGTAAGTYLHKRSEVAPDAHPVGPIRAGGVVVAGRDHRLRRDLGGELDGRDVLQKPDKHERRLVVCELSA